MTVVDAEPAPQAESTDEVVTDGFAPSEVKSDPKPAAEAVTPE